MYRTKNQVESFSYKSSHKNYKEKDTPESYAPSCHSHEKIPYKAKVSAQQTQ